VIDEEDTEGRRNGSATVEPEENNRGFVLDEPLG